jgi:uncharacterized membrane protein
MRLLGVQNECRHSKRTPSSIFPFQQFNHWFSIARKAPCFQLISRVSELCQNLTNWAPWRSVLSEEQTPQVVVFSRKWSEKVEQKDRVLVRPRQVRYQAAQAAHAAYLFHAALAGSGPILGVRSPARRTNGIGLPSSVRGRMPCRWPCR